MKQTNYILLFVFFLTFDLLQAQEEKQSKFNIMAYGGIGYGIVDNENEPNYNLNSNNGEILLNYKLNQNFGIATGIGYIELTGNGFNSTGNFYHERTILKIPLLATLNHKVSGKFKMIPNFGFYTQTIVKEEYRFLTDTQKDVFDGWNFGVQLGVIMVFEMFKSFSFGVNYLGQSDFSKFKTNNNLSINDEQELKNLNSIGLILLIEL